MDRDLLISRRKNNWLKSDEFFGLRGKSLDEDLEQAIGEDNKEEFIRLVRREWESKGVARTFIWKQILVDYVLGPINCLTALLKRETPLTVDLNRPCCDFYFPIHIAALRRTPHLAKLLLDYGARTDVRCASETFPDRYNKLPLHLALNRLSEFEELSEWTPKQSIFSLLAMLCLPRIKNTLEIIRLLAWTTNETEDYFFHLARDGKIMELAALLIVARNKLINPICQVSNFIQNNDMLIEENKKEAIAHVVPLFKVFEKAGDAIEAYIKQQRIDLYITVEQVMDQVANLLRDAGCSLKPTDADLRDFNWYHRYLEANQRRFICVPGSRYHGCQINESMMENFTPSTRKHFGVFTKEELKELNRGVVSVPNKRSFFTSAAAAADGGSPNTNILCEEASTCYVLLHKAAKAEATEKWFMFNKTKAWPSRPFLMQAMKRV